MIPTIFGVAHSDSRRTKEEEMTATETAPRLVGEARSLAEREVDAGVPDIVDVWGRDSFPASDAPANW
jgi:hypothetical protein